MIQVTQSAVRELANLVGETGRGLRLLVQKGGCAGFQYGMKLDDAREEDTVFETSGGRIFVDPQSLPYLKNVEVDYSDELTDTGFKIRNPDAARSCGCGTSFEPAESGGEESALETATESACGGEGDAAREAEAGQTSR